MSSKNFIIKNGLSVGSNEVIDSNGNIVTEESTIQNGIVPFVQPLHYKGHPHESNNGFMYINHRIDQRVSV